MYKSSLVSVWMVSLAAAVACGPEDGAESRDGGTSTGAVGTFGTGGDVLPNDGSGGTSAASAGGNVSNVGASGGSLPDPMGTGAATGNGSGGGGEPPSTPCGGTANYQIAVDLTWDDPDVQNKHYTTIVGAVHDASVTLWEVGALSTPGIKAMAETGAKTPLDQEVAALVASGGAEKFIEFAGGDSPGQSAGVTTITPEFPLVSFGSMLAPTPDWFVGVSSFSLCQDGSWIESASVDAVAYDAGTKNGDGFTYGNGYTSPPVPIELQPTLLLEGVPRSFGTISFDRMD